MQANTLTELAHATSEQPAPPLSADELRKMDAYWRAANYLSVGQIYLYDNPLLTEPLRIEHIKPRLLGHWGTTPGLNFIYVHCNRLIKKYDLNMIYVCGPGHGGPGMVANTYLEGTYTRVLSQHHAGRRGNEAAVQAILVSRRHSQPRRAGNSRLDQRRRRTGILAAARLRRGVRQSRPDRLLRHRRRRSRDRRARHQLAFQQIPQSRARRRGAPDPASERLQDRRTHRARPHPARGIDELLQGYGYARISSKATNRSRCIRPWRRRSIPSSKKSAPSRKTRASTDSPSARCGP